MADQQQESTWIDQLSEEISELLANPKLVKFNTHKNRKLFTGQILGMIKEAVHKNTLPKNEKPTRASTPTITRPNPEPSVGHTVMTEGVSQRVDDVRDSIARKNRVGVRTW